MADNRKYYYLKLKENFFDSDSIVLLEDMKDGILYSNILLKLYLKSLKNAKAKAAYRQKHESDFIIADAAARYFKENGISKLPGYKALQAEIESLIQEKNSGYNDYRAKREEYRRLQTVKGNIDQILHRERKPVKRQEQER